MILTNRVRNRKPPPGATILKSGLGRGIVCAVICRGTTQGTLIDEAGNYGALTPTGTLKSVPGATGREALYFSSNTTTSSVSTKSPFAFNGAYSWMIVFKADNAPSGGYVGQPFTHTNRQTFSFSWSHTDANFQQAPTHKDNLGNFTACKIVTPMVGGRWYRVVCTYDGTSNLKAYLNGVLETTKTGVAAGDGTAGGIALGNGANSEICAIDHAVVWKDRALTAGEVLSLQADPFSWMRPEIRRPLFGTSAASVNLTGGGLDNMRAFTESGGGTIQSNTTNLTGGGLDTLRSLLELGGGNIGLAGGGSQLLRAFQSQGDGVSDAPPIQVTPRGGRAWWGYESFDGSNKPWWYRDLADKAKELERQRQIRIDLGILPKPEAKKIAKLTKSVDQFIEDMPTPETADAYIARASELADELELLIDQLQNEDDDEVIMTMSRFFFNQRAHVCQMQH